MQKLKHHFFVCGSFRINGEPQGICSKKGSFDLIQYIENEILDRGMEDAMVSSTGCLKACTEGPVMIVYPDGDWYGNLTEEAVDEILDAIEEGEKATDYIISE